MPENIKEGLRSFLEHVITLHAALHSADATLTVHCLLSPQRVA